MEETITHTELCERIKNILLLSPPEYILYLLQQIEDEYTEMSVEYLGDGLYSWKQNEEL